MSAGTLIDDVKSDRRTFVLFPLKETPLVGDVKRLAATDLVDNTYRTLMSLVTSFGQSLDGRSMFCTLDESSSAQ